MTEKIRPFDIAEHLESEADIRAFLEEVSQTGDSTDFIHALNTAARAKGMSSVAREAGVSRASLYKSLGEGGQPKFETIDKVVHALGFKLTIQSL